MQQMFGNLNAIETFYLVCGFTGGSIFFVKLILQFFGGFDVMHGHDMIGAHTDIGLGHTDIDVAHSDSDVSFRALTLLGLSSFFMMFGLVGFALYRENQTGALLSLLGASAAGAATVWIIGKLFAFASKLQSSGTVENVSTIGAEGEVYLSIPPGGTGRVMISFKDHLREFDAVSKNKDTEIKTGERIKVVWVEGSVLVVEKI